MRSARVALAAVLLALPVAATVRIQDEAKKAGYAAEDCNYCHSFGGDHMRERARRMGVNNLDCVRCHGGHLPKMGEALYNERGHWLRRKKVELQAPRVDVTWLKDYVEKDKPKK